MTTAQPAVKAHAFTPIDRAQTQRNLAARGLYHGAIDGSFGRLTYAGLFAALAAPKANPAVLTALGIQAAASFPAYGIDASVERLTDLLAEGENETGGFTTWEENLRYSAERIHAVWPARFPTVASARPYAFDPSDPDREDIALANRVYGDRMGNQLNGLNDNDGWDSRGKGFLMLTGLANLRAAESRLHMGLIEHPDFAADPAKSLVIACDFYAHNGVLAALDDGDALGARKITNIGNRYASAVPVGWANVQAQRARARAIVAATA